MELPRSASRAILAAAAAALLAGCGAAQQPTGSPAVPDSTAQTPSSGAPTEGAVTPTPAEEPDLPGTVSSGDLALVTNEGYTLTANMSVAVEVGTDITSAPPGEADVVVGVTGSVQVTNTTAGRTVPAAAFTSVRAFVVLGPGPACDLLVGKSWHAQDGGCALDAGVFPFPINANPQGLAADATIALPLVDEALQTQVGHEERVRLSEADARVVTEALGGATQGLSWFEATGPVTPAGAPCGAGVLEPNLVWTTSGSAACY